MQSAPRPLQQPGPRRKQGQPATVRPKVSPKKSERKAQTYSSIRKRNAMPESRTTRKAIVTCVPTGPEPACWSWRRPNSVLVIESARPDEDQSNGRQQNPLNNAELKIVEMRLSSYRLRCQQALRRLLRAHTISQSWPYKSSCGEVCVCTHRLGRSLPRCL